MNRNRERLLVAGPDRLKLLILSIVMLAGVAATQHVRAAEPLVWNCWFDGRTQYVLCEPQQQLPPVQLASGETLEIPVIADTETAESVPASLAERGPAQAPSSLWRFPMHTQPTDMGEVKTLARILMCHRQPDCRVDFVAAR